MAALVAEHTFRSKSAAQTRGLGHALGACLAIGDFVGLVGDLGLGKTVFARGVSDGAGVPDGEAASPTFAIVYPYRGRLPLYHADFYRLTDIKELHAIGFFEMAEDGAVLVEWIDRIPEAEPEDTLRVAFRELAEEVRELHAQARGPRSVKLLETWRATAPPDSSGGT